MSWIVDALGRSLKFGKCLGEPKLKGPATPQVGAMVEVTWSLRFEEFTQLQMKLSAAQAGWWIIPNQPKPLTNLMCRPVH